MPKLKSKKGAVKRFKITGTGKVKFTKAKRRHILTSKPTKRKRQMRPAGYVASCDEKNVKQMILGC